MVCPLKYEGYFPKKDFHGGQMFWGKNVWGGYSKWEN